MKRRTHYTSKFNNRVPGKNERYIAFDGAGPRTLGGTKCMGVGVVLYTEDLTGIQDYTSMRIISPYSTNIYAEIHGLEEAMKLCVAQNNPDVNWVIWGDCKYIVDGFYHPDMVRKEHLLAVMKRIQALGKQLKWRVTVKWVQGEQNQDADFFSRITFEDPDRPDGFEYQTLNDLDNDSLSLENDTVRSKPDN